MTDPRNVYGAHCTWCDPRIVFGARCTWWDSIGNVAHKPSGLPCCPNCGGVLFEMPNEATWWASVDKHAKRTSDPGYRPFIEWLRGKCLPLPFTLTDARAEYDAERSGGT